MMTQARNHVIELESKIGLHHRQARTGMRGRASFLNDKWMDAQTF